ncbi:DUF202 domain-containing protein [Micromonospora fluostatini]|uniref:DUF202 domain-containing protein n=1 Tax=Micromonospora sp. JCM 30529 TaxID=3421643 RepID=UPI003D163DB2
MSRPGLHVERTTLAWRRTAAAAVLAALVAGRILAPHLGYAALAVTAPVAAGALVAVIGVLPRRASAARPPAAVGVSPRPPRPAPALLALLAATTALAGLAAAGAVLLT